MHACDIKFAVLNVCSTLILIRNIYTLKYTHTHRCLYTRQIQSSGTGVAQHGGHAVLEALNMGYELLVGVALMWG